MTRAWIGICMLGGLVMAGRSYAVSVTLEEMAKARTWLEAGFRDGQTAPFSFTYDGRRSNELLKGWESKHGERRLDEYRRQHTLTYTDPKTQLILRCVAVEYKDFPTIEWTLYLRNGGPIDTPILEDLQALDARFERHTEGEFTLHHHTGSPSRPNDFEPHETVLAPKAVKRITAAGGRPTSSDLSYFNIAWPGEGVIVAVGWPGQWAATFTRDGANGLRVRAGQELTHFRLHPGEEVRSPLIALQFYKGDRIRSQNVWRRWMVAHNMPRPGGSLPPPLWTPCSSHQFGEMIHANEENQKAFIDRYVEEGLKPDYWWMDAGWYINDGTWVNTGTWEVDTKRFPHGLRAVSDHAHSKGIKIITWFEPERVTKGTWLYEKHPEWLLAPKGLRKDLAYQKDWRLLNLGDPKALEWLTNHVDKILTEQGIDLYRQDFNMDPLWFWRANDTEDRQGITEIKHVIGYLAYWDELCRRHANMLIDTCASGGRRLDLETLRRSVPFLRSDFLFEPAAEQGHLYGISFWIPYHGTGVVDTESMKASKIYPPAWMPKGEKQWVVTNTYLYRSVMSPHLTPCFDMRKRDLDYVTLRRLTAEWRRIAPCYYGDYYPLTPYSLANDRWMAWQFDRPDLGQGVVQAFRRGQSVSAVERFKLCGLQADARYSVANVDVVGTTEMTGRQLMEEGLSVQIQERPGSAVIAYKRIH
jgi:alpha-galactosidase